MSAMRLVSSTPSTIILPASCFSIWLMHRMRVDLPEPDGPQSTIFSPLSTLRVTSFSAVNAPNRFITFSTMTISAGRVALLTVACGMFVSQMRGGSVPRWSAGRGSSISLAKGGDALGRRRTDDEIGYCYDEIHFDEAAVELRELGGGTEKIRQRQDIDERSVLKQDDRLAQDNRACHPQDLREDNVAVGVVGGQREGLAGLKLALVHGTQSNADDLGIVGRLEQAESDEGGIGGADRDGAAVAAKVPEHDRYQEEKPEQNEDQRDRPDDRHVAADDLGNQGNLEVLRQRKAGSENHADGERGGCERQ